VLRPYKDAVAAMAEGVARDPLAMLALSRTFDRSMAAVLEAAPSSTLRLSAAEIGFPHLRLGSRRDRGWVAVGIRLPACSGARAPAPHHFLQFPRVQVFWRP